MKYQQKNQTEKDQEKWLNLGNLQYFQNEKNKIQFFVKNKIVKKKVSNWKFENYLTIWQKTFKLANVLWCLTILIAHFSSATFVKIGANYRNLAHYNKQCPYKPSDSTGVWVNSLVPMNMT